MNIALTDLNDGTGKVYPVRVLRIEENYYLSAEEVAVGLKFEGTGIRNVKDWLRSSSKEMDFPSVKYKGVFYSPEVFADAFRKKLPKIEKDYPNSFKSVALWIQSEEGFGKSDFENMLSRLEFEPVENYVQKPSGATVKNEEEKIVQEVQTEEERAKIEEKRRQAEKEERLRLEAEAEFEERRQKEKARQAKADRRQDTIDENRSRLKIFFTNPVILFIPLFAAIVASGVDMALVFMDNFKSDFASIALSVVFSSIVLIFTFNSEGRGGRAFVICFALIEAAVNAVYFGLVPSGYEETIVQLCATVGLPLSLVAYAGLFTKFTKTEESVKS